MHISPYVGAPMRGLLSFFRSSGRDLKARAGLFVATSSPQITRDTFVRANRDFPETHFTVVAPNSYRSLFPPQVSFISNEEIKAAWWQQTRELRKARKDLLVITLDGRPFFRLPKLWAFLTNCRSIWAYSMNGERIPFRLSQTRIVLKQLAKGISRERSDTAGAFPDLEKRPPRRGVSVRALPDEPRLRKVTKEREPFMNWTPELVNEFISCPMCTCPYCQTVAAKAVGGATFRVLHCCNVDCLHGFIFPVPTLELLSTIYGQNMLNDYLIEPSTIQANTQFFSHLFREYIPQAFPTPGQLLDVGAGIGTFVATARNFGWSAVGIEFNEQSVLWAKEKFSIQLQQGDFQYLERFFPPHFADLVTFNHVFEHILDPASYIPYVTRFLKPGGCVLTSVPNILSDQFRKQQASWSYIHIPAHISYFSRFSMDAVFLLNPRLPGGRFERVFQSTFPPLGEQEGEGLTSMYRWVSNGAHR
jgi:SAM-dependent methyltransferase